MSLSALMSFSRLFPESMFDDRQKQSTTHARPREKNRRESEHDGSVVANPAIHACR